MKKLFSLLAISFSLIAGFSACGEEDATYTPTSSNIKIVSKDVYFDCLGGEGSVVFDAEAKVSYSCDSAWVSLAEVKQGTLSVKVAKNYELGARNAVIKLTDGNGTLDVVIVQMGVTQDYSVKVYGQNKKPSIFHYKNEDFGAFWIPSNDAATAEYKFASLEPVELLSLPEWLSMEITTDSTFSVSVEPNTTGAVRQGTIIYESGALISMLVVTQFDYQQLLQNSDAYLYFSTVGENGFEDGTMPAVLTNTGIELPDFKGYSKDKKTAWKIPFSIENNTLNYTFTSCKKVGDVQGMYDVYNVGVTKAGSVSFQSASAAQSLVLADGYSFIPVSFGPNYWGFGLGLVSKGKALNENNLQQVFMYLFDVDLLLLPKQQTGAAELREWPATKAKFTRKFLQK